jgi:ferredoxin-NADP reductase
VKEYAGAKSFTIRPDPARGTKELAYFRAGQYVAFSLDIDGAHVNRPYTLQSGPRQALGENGSYTVTVKQSKNGFASQYILENWKVGTPVTLSGPQGEFYYQGIRDARHVVALAGGSGITPFCSMAAAIADGTEDFSLTILYGSRSADAILLKDELDALESAGGGRVRVVHVLSDVPAEGYESGFLTAALIRKYAPEGDFSIFVCGPKVMYPFAEKEFAALCLPRRRLREELSGEYGSPFKDADYPAAREDAEFHLTVVVRGEPSVIPCRRSETLLESMERAGIRAPSHCRSGECGWCHSLLVSGEVYIPASVDGRRLADRKFGWVHPCVTYPLGNVTLDVPVG